ncbi:MAG TPA: ABC transporter ATP-binding protein [Gammaproteobacteria bacterium]|nr:ABC transporter ATP-binding protein [Gammaproteobacteria bacterium]
MSILLEQVSKEYGGAAPAVSDVTTHIAEGELFVLLGPSGSGKSTLLRAIAGLTTIDHGRIVLHGRDVTNLGAKDREVGFVFQNYALFRHMTVADNIEFALRARRVRGAERRRRRAELLKLVSLEGYDQRLPSELSGGQQQRVALARALAHQPRVLLLDEPFGALDAKIRDELRRAIREIQRAVGITTILVTHDQEEAFSMADRIGVMDRGRLQEVGEPRVLYQRPGTRFVATFLGAANLLLGPYGYRDIQLGESFFQVDRWSRSLRSGDEAAVVVRPEDVVLAEHREQLNVPVVSTAKVLELQFVGANERLRLEVAAADTLASAQRPGAATFQIDASRTAREVELLPLEVGQTVHFGFKRMHALPTPISSLRLIAKPGETGNELVSTSIVRELSDRMHIEPLFYEGASEKTQRVRGLPVVTLDPDADLGEALVLLEQGARQVLAVGDGRQQIERMLIYVEPSSCGRDAALAASASLARHLTIDVTMLVRDDERSISGGCYRDLLDLRNTSLRLHGLDIRTETFRGNAPQVIRERLASSDEQTLLVIGLTSPERCSDLVDDLKQLLRESPPAAVLFVSGRDEQEPQAVAAEQPAYAAAFAL